MSSKTKVEARSTTAPSRLPLEYRQKILALRRPPNWDGEGADPISAAACKAALVFVERVLAAQPSLSLPRPAPSVMGSVSLYWSREDEGLLVEISSADPANVSYHWEGPNGRYEEGVEHRDAAVSRVLAFHLASPTGY